MESEAIAIQTTFLRELLKIIDEYGKDSTFPLVCFMKEWAEILLKKFAKEDASEQYKKLLVRHTQLLANVLRSTVCRMLPWDAENKHLRQELMLHSGAHREHEQSVPVLRYLGWDGELFLDIL